MDNHAFKSYLFLSHPPPNNVKVLFFLAIFVSCTFLTAAYAQTYDLYVQKMPVVWKDQYSTVLSEATKYWEEKTPGLKFNYVTYPDQADFVVEWGSKTDDGKFGSYATGSQNYYNKPAISITLGFFKDRKLATVSPEYALDITKHMFGHLLSLPHSTDPNDIMYPSVEYYDSWLQSHQEIKIKPSKNSSKTDWQSRSQKYQTKASNRIIQLEPQVDAANSLLLTAPYTNKAAQAEIQKGWTAYWAAKKSLDDAQKAQTDGGALVLESKYKESYTKFKQSYDFTKIIEKKIADIKKYNKKAYELQYGKNNTKS
jgi:hypothetical protein